MIPFHQTTSNAGKLVSGSCAGCVED